MYLENCIKVIDQSVNLTAKVKRIQGSQLLQSLTNFNYTPLQGYRD